MAACHIQMLKISRPFSISVFSAAWTALSCSVFLTWCSWLLILFPSRNKHPTSPGFNSEHMWYSWLLPTSLLKTKEREISHSKSCQIVNSDGPTSLGVVEPAHRLIVLEAMDPFPWCFSSTVNFSTYSIWLTPKFLLLITCQKVKCSVGGNSMQLLNNL